MIRENNNNYISEYEDGIEGDRITIEEVNEEIRIGGVDPKADNSYAAKKTVAQGMMDIALITANANQLKFLIQFTDPNGVSFYVSVILIVFSILLQVAIGVCLIFKGRLDFKGHSKKHTAKVINNYVVIGVFLVTIINVFIASFTMHEAKKDPP
ncbi:ninjurin-related [Holotrichia oblita]|uniref:Ninjurin-related n=1 Tax=Holotrichia oblita TaxID=644536 RepID=A0ACB9TXV1_HOLOL|nr:ninjurin-related [Holotrichia oblita]